MMLQQTGMYHPATCYHRPHTLPVGACRVVQQRRRTPTQIRALDNSAPPTQTDVNQAKQEAQQWIQNWRTKTGDPATPGVASSSTAAPSAAKAEAQEWIRAWRARSLEKQLQQESGLGDVFADYASWGLSLGALYAGNKLLADACTAAGITFPAPLLGMFAIVGALLLLSKTSPSTADAVYDAFSPAVDWIARWLPLFYVPLLVTIPLSIQTIPVADLAKVLFLVVIGMVASLLFTAQTAVAIRSTTNTELLPQPPTPPLPPFDMSHYLAWGTILAGSLIATPTVGTAAALPAGLSATVFGYLVGNALPGGVKKFIHPIVTCGLIGNLGVAAQGALSGVAYDESLRAYLTKNPATMGGGDLLMSFLGVVILTFGFKIYSQRNLMTRHAPEIFGATLLSSLFSLFGTAAAGKLLGLAPELTRAIVPRSVTVALAMPIAQQLQVADVSITAVVVLLTGLLGAATVQLLLDVFQYKDPIARGLATAGSAHGLGTAALSAKEPDALPFCALAYALIGVISSVLASLPIVQQAIFAITG